MTNEKENDEKQIDSLKMRTKELYSKIVVAKGGDVMSVINDVRMLEEDILGFQRNTKNKNSHNWAYRMLRHITSMREGYDNIREFLHSYPCIVSPSYPNDPYSEKSDSRFFEGQQQFESRIGRYAGIPKKVDANGCIIRASVE